MKKKLLALFITMALILTPVATVSSVLTMNKTSAEAAVVYLDGETPDDAPNETTTKTQIKGTWNDERFIAENAEDESKYMVMYIDPDGKVVNYDSLTNGIVYRMVVTIGEEYRNDYEFEEGLRKSEEEPWIAEHTFTLTSGEQNNDNNGEQGDGEQNGEPEPEEPAVPMDTSMKTNIMGYVVLGMVVICGLFALILMMTDKNKGGPVQKAPKKKKEKE